MDIKYVEDTLYRILTEMEEDAINPFPYNPVLKRQIVERMRDELRNTPHFGEGMGLPYPVTE